MDPVHKCRLIVCGRVEISQLQVLAVQGRSILQGRRTYSAMSSVSNRLTVLVVQSTVLYGMCKVRGEDIGEPRSDMVTAKARAQGCDPRKLARTKWGVGLDGLLRRGTTESDAVGGSDGLSERDRRGNRDDTG